MVKKGVDNTVLLARSTTLITPPFCMTNKWFGSPGANVANSGLVSPDATSVVPLMAPFARDANARPATMVATYRVVFILAPLESWVFSQQSMCPGFHMRLAVLLGHLRSDNLLFDLTPELSIKHAVINRFADVFRQNVGAAVQVGDGARDAKHLVVRARRKSQLLNAVPKQVHSGLC